ncbi:MAG: cell wall hydrolase [Clostridia bacterium]|nr:cell wall hydrolase [Clostridia bacterium]
MKILKIAILGGLCIALASACTARTVKNVAPETVKEGTEAASAEKSEYMTETPAETSQALAEISLDEDDRALISWLIACEIGDRPFSAQVCLASVILNRLGDSGFSETVRGVIFESGDFRSVSRGEVTGGVGKAEKSTNKFKIAAAALEEALVTDPTGGALYFGYLEDGRASSTGTYECGGMFFGR